MAKPPSKDLPFGLSADQFAAVTREMLAVARSVCRHSSVSPGDAVQQAFVKALSKPSAERPSIQDEKKFVAWLCTLAKYEALTNRNDQRRRAQREIDSVTDIAELVVVPPSVGSVEARKMLYDAFTTLEPADQSLLHALYAEGKTIDDVARQEDQPWTTVDSRRKRVLALLHAAIRATIAALMLVPKRARAFVAHVTQQGPHVLVQATQLGGVMAVIAVCGVLLPTGSSAMTEPSMSVGLTPYITAQPTMAQQAGLRPSFLPEVAPEEPKTLDALTNPCSAGDMKSTKIARYLQGTALPFVFLVAPALTQVACVGTEQQTPPPQQPEDESDLADERERADLAYRIMCSQERARGNKCPSKEEWLK